MVNEHTMNIFWVLSPASDYTGIKKELSILCPFLWYLWLLGYPGVSACLQRRHTQPRRWSGVPCWDASCWVRPYRAGNIYNWYLACYFLFVCFLVLQWLAGEKCVAISNLWVSTVTVDGRWSPPPPPVTCQLCLVSYSFQGFWVWGWDQQRLTCLTNNVCHGLGGEGVGNGGKGILSSRI